MQSFALVVSASLWQVFVKFLLADWKSFADVSLQLGVSSLVVKVSKFLASSSKCFQSKKLRLKSQAVSGLA